MLQVEDVSVRFEGQTVLDQVDLTVADGELVAVLGPSGSGKTTLLRVIAGLQPVDTGRVLLDGRDVTRTPTHRRDVGLVFQDHALFLHRDVFDNVAFGLRMHGGSRRDIHARVTELLALVGLEGFEQRSIGTLSGGEQQRVALARALAPEPRVLLLDEPLASLDRRLRDRLLEDLERLFDDLGVTGVYVTHDQTEAFALGDRVAVLRAGRIVQVAPPDELWAGPADEDVARFLGLRNVLDGAVVRPEAVTLRRVENGRSGDGVVVSCARTGPTVVVRIRLDDGRELEAAVASVEHPRPGDRVEVEIDPLGVVELQ